MWWWRRWPPGSDGGTAARGWLAPGANCCRNFIMSSAEGCDITPLDVCWLDEWKGFVAGEVIPVCVLLRSYNTRLDVGTVVKFDIKNGGWKYIRVMRHTIFKQNLTGKGKDFTKVERIGVWKNWTFVYEVIFYQKLLKYYPTSTRILWYYWFAYLLDIYMLVYLRLCLIILIDWFYTNLSRSDAIRKLVTIKNRWIMYVRIVCCRKGCKQSRFPSRMYLVAVVYMKILLRNVRRKCTYQIINEKGSIDIEYVTVVVVLFQENTLYFVDCCSIIM